MKLNAIMKNLERKKWKNNRILFIFSNINKMSKDKNMNKCQRYEYLKNLISIIIVSNLLQVHHNYYTYS